jgi:dienelactone hydrolase
MTGFKCAAAAALIALGTAAPAVSGQIRQEDGKWAATAEAFVRAMDAGDFDAALQMTAASVSEHFTPAKMKPVWAQMSGGKRVGSIMRESVLHTGGYSVVDLGVALGAQTVRLRVAIDSTEKVQGFFRLPDAQSSGPEYTAPSYVDKTKFEDWPMALSAGEYRLPAKLTLPRGVKNAPLVVLVHGSGPNDMDESIGPNFPFRDIAWGLATQGIAVLRYDKRTKVAATQAASAAGKRALSTSITVDEEVILDAISALDSGRINPNIDMKRTFLLGHSLGAMLAPEIAMRDGKLAGVVLLAGTPRKLANVMVDQFAYLKSLPANSSADAQRMIGDVEAELQRLIRREPKPDELIMGAPASYFYDLDLRDAMKFAKAVKVPMLFLQGARDYQVLPLDLELWETGLKGHANTSFKLYPDLNHLFMTGTGKATPTEYSQPGHVAAEVVADIARFVLQTK